MTGSLDNPPPGNAPPVRVLVADDQTTVREGLVTLLGLAPGIQVVGAAGVTATARIRAEHPETEVVVLTTFADDTNILAALNAGALGYLTKDAGRAQITRALRAAAGQAVLDPAVHARLLAAASANTPLPPGPAAPPTGWAGRPGSRRPGAHRRRPDQHPNRRPALRLFSKTGTHDRAQAVSYAHHHHHLTHPPAP